MTSTYRAAPHLGRPVERHKLTPAAEAARRAVADRRANARAELVTEHRRPVAPGPIPANAQRLADIAKAAGFEVRALHGEWALYAGQSNERRVASVKVEGIDRARRVGFVAIWAAGSAKLGLWYDGRAQAGTRLPDDVGVTEVAARVRNV
jgi:hypothetical protein